MAKTIDACGLTCPAPVLLVKDAVDAATGQEIIVLVDNAASLENVTRFLNSRGYKVEDSKEGGLFRIKGRCDAQAKAGSETRTDNAQNRKKHEPGTQKIVVLVTTDSLGSGDEVLGSKLMVSYLKTLKEMESDLWQLIFVNGGVKLTIESSPVLSELQEYEKAGVVILACGTCLEHFNLTAQKQVGGTTNMLDIVTATQLADKVVTIS